MKNCRRNQSFPAYVECRKELSLRRARWFLIGFIVPALFITTAQVGRALNFSDETGSAKAVAAAVPRLNEGGVQQQTKARAIERPQSPAEEKRSRTKAQKKLDTQLLYAIKQQRKEPGTPALVVDVKVDLDGRTLVDISANVTQQLLAKIRKLGGTVISKFEKYHTIRARLPLQRLEELAGSNDVKYIMPAQEGMTN